MAGITLDMEIKELFKEYWWLSIMTISVFTFIYWIFHKLATGKPIRLTAEAKRLTFIKVMLFVVILNFGVWGVGTVALHGDAVNGKNESNKYFLSWKGHYTQVSRGTYIYSWIHTCITIVSFPALIVLFAIADIREKGLAQDKKTSANESPEPPADRRR